MNDMHDFELEDIERWLEHQPVSLWGKFYYITESDGKERAAIWFYRQIQAFKNWKQSLEPVDPEIQETETT